jgi:hypothetical protein
MVGGWTIVWRPIMGTVQKVSISHPKAELAYLSSKGKGKRSNETV